MSELTKLFSPGRIGKMELKNRLVMAPMMALAAFGKAGILDEEREGYISSRVMDWFAGIAKGGVSLVLGESSTILPESHAASRAGAFDDRFIPGLRGAAEAMQQNGAYACFQLLHHGRILTTHRRGLAHSEVIDPVCPSAIPWGRRGEIAREASKADIKHLVDGFVEAARRLRDAGFDAVELKGAHGYGIGQFLSPHSNKRTDEYGGTPEKRARFACEIITSIKERLGDDFAVIFLMSSSEYIRDGITLEESLIQAPLFAKAGADALHVEGGVADMTPYITNPCYLLPDALFADDSAAIKKVVSIPVIVGGKIGDPVLANQILEEGKADFVSMARPLLADPELPNKAREGKLDEIRYCLWCNNCWDMSWRENFKKRGIRSCTVNPALMRVKEFELKPAAQPKKVLVVGGGLAGMEAAKVLDQRGHKVVLCEKSQELGGQWNIAAQITGKEHYAGFGDQMIRDLGRSGVETRLNQEVNSEFVREISPDEVVVATGALPLVLNIPGIEGKNVVQAVDVITGKASVGQRVVVMGGRYLGMEIALMLAEQGKHVSLTTLHELGRNHRFMERYTLATLRQKIVENGIYIYAYAPVEQICDDGVYINHGPELFFLKADTVVLAAGVSPQRKLLEELESTFSDLKIHAIGDCAEPRDAAEAMREGAETGMAI
jgi:2,4-dienoyl-CoA reductase-like NADH-dependent reductase (Old Yellow Enzyme family)/thioredoxin reductase